MTERARDPRLTEVQEAAVELTKKRLKESEAKARKEGWRFGHIYDPEVEEAKAPEAKEVKPKAKKAKK